jgi:hypothetical protein
MTFEIPSTTTTTTIQPYDQGKPSAPSNAQDAVDKIKGLENGADAKEVNNAIDAIAKLNATEAKQVFDQLAADGKKNGKDYFQSLAHEMVDTGWRGGGVSLKNRERFFKDVAEKLSGPQLASLEKAFATADKSDINARSIDELSKAIATFSDGKIKADYIKALAPTAVDQKDASSGHTSYNNFDPEARSISTVLAGFKSPNAAGFPESLAAIKKEPGAYDAVINASMKPTEKYNAFAQTYLKSYDTTQFQAIAKLMEASGSSLDKAQFIKSAGNILPKVENAKDRESIALAMKSVIDSDVVGVISKLAGSSEVLGGDALANYSRVMLEDVKNYKDPKTGKTLNGEQLLNEQIKSFISSSPKDTEGLKSESKKTTWQLFQQGGQPSPEAQERAQALGFLVGSVAKGLKNINADIDKKRELASAVFNDILGPLAGLVKGGMGANTASLLIADALFKNKEVNINKVLAAIFSPATESGDLDQLVINKLLLGNMEDGAGLVN